MMFVVVDTVCIKFLFRMVLCNKGVYWIIFQTLLNRAQLVPGLCLHLSFVLLYEQHICVAFVK